MSEQDEQESLRSWSNGDELLTWQDYKAMSFTQCVIDETLRLGGIAIWLMREAKEDVNYQGTQFHFYLIFI
jgi:cytochrome P450